MKHASVQNGSPCECCGLIPLASGMKSSPRLVARSKAMKEGLRRASRFAASDAPVVVLGETGAGKEVLARVLHANSARADRSFVAVNVAALPAELLESELFGHGKGAFTGAAGVRRGLFEEADGGTLFLDEIAEMPLAMQVKLLRVLQDGEVRRVGQNRPFSVDVRIVCATHRNLAARVEEGLFREDLYYRLKVLTLKVPPLRDRPEDIVGLAQEFLRTREGPVNGFTDAAKERLLRHPWPGNVRELHNAVRHGLALATSSKIDVCDLPDEVQKGVASVVGETVSSPELRSLKEMERDHILNVLHACDGSQAEAADVLGIGRSTLWRKLKLYSQDDE